MKVINQNFNTLYPWIDMFLCYNVTANISSEEH